MKLLKELLKINEAKSFDDWMADMEGKYDDPYSRRNFQPKKSGYSNARNQMIDKMKPISSLDSHLQQKFPFDIHFLKDSRMHESGVYSISASVFFDKTDKEFDLKIGFYYTDGERQTYDHPGTDPEIEIDTFLYNNKNYYEIIEKNYGIKLIEKIELRLLEHITETEFHDDYDDY